MLKGFVPSDNELRVKMIKEVGMPCYVVYLTILSHKISDDDKVFPTYETIAKECDCSTQNIKKHIKTLKEKGYIIVDSGKSGKANNYWFPHEKDFKETEQCKQAHSRKAYKKKEQSEVTKVTIEQADIPYPTNVEPTKEETRAIDSLNSNSFTLSDLIEEFKKRLGAKNTKETISNNTKNLQNNNDINLDIVRELFNKYLDRNRDNDSHLHPNQICAGMLSYANNNYDKAIEEEREYQRRKEQEQANFEKELAKMNENLTISEPVETRNKKKNVMDISEFVNDNTLKTIDMDTQNENIATENVKFELVYEEENLNDYDNFSYYDEEYKPLSEIDRLFD